MIAILRPFFLPLFFIGSFTASIIYQVELEPMLRPMLPMLFYFLATAAIFVSWHYNRTRFLFVILPIIALHWALIHVKAPAHIPLQQITALLLPWHLLIFLWLKERAIISVGGIFRLLLITTEIAAVYYVVFLAPETLTPFSTVQLFSESIKTLTPFYDLTIVLTLLAFIIMVSVVVLHPLRLYSTAFMTLFLLLFIAVHFSQQRFYIEMAGIHAMALLVGVLLMESYRLAFYDELTGLPGRRALMEATTRLGRRYSLAMVDIDHFKKFNDTYGHDTGDDVLKLVAQILATVKNGKAYRYGGEEFTIIWNSADRDDALIYMDAIREKIATTPFLIRRAKKGKKPAKPKKVTINVSAGVVEKIPGDSDVLDAMKRADKALYKAKKQGRNRVVKG